MVHDEGENWGKTHLIKAHSWGDALSPTQKGVCWGVNTGQTLVDSHQQELREGTTGAPPRGEQDGGTHWGEALNFTNKGACWGFLSPRAEEASQAKVWVCGSSYPYVCAGDVA